MDKNFTVRDIMTSSVLTVEPDTSIKEAAVLLVENAISGMPVVDSNGEPVGILSEKDILKHLLKSKSEGREAADRVKDYMSDIVWTLEATTPVESAAEILLDTSYGRLPVVENGRFVGIVSYQDFIQAMV